jgi:dihydrofolate reductase
MFCQRRQQVPALVHQGTPTANCEHTADMATPIPHITLHMVASLDGFIASPDNELSWMEASWAVYEKGTELTDAVVAEFLQRVDCYIMGSHTYELALELGWPYGDTRTIVVTSRRLAATRDSVEFHAGDLTALVRGLGQQNAWLVGGPTLYQEFLRLDLVDEVCLSMAPVLLGEGTPFYRGGRHKLGLKDMTAYRSGMIELLYEVIRH